WANIRFSFFIDFIPHFHQNIVSILLEKYDEIVFFQRQLAIRYILCYHEESISKGGGLMSAIR
ncbi:hypothetical protein, partial [Merdimonas faecis]